MLACAASLITRISQRKRIFKKKHFNLFIRGPDRFDKKKKNANKSRDTATLREFQTYWGDGGGDFSDRVFQHCSIKEVPVRKSPRRPLTRKEGKDARFITTVGYGTYRPELSDNIARHLAILGYTLKNKFKNQTSRIKLVYRSRPTLAALPTAP